MAEFNGFLKDTVKFFKNLEKNNSDELQVPKLKQPQGGCTNKNFDMLCRYHKCHVKRQPEDAALSSSPYGSGSFLGDNAPGEEADTVDDVRDASEAKSDAEMTASSRKRNLSNKTVFKNGTSPVPLLAVLTMFFSRS